MSFVPAAAKIFPMAALRAWRKSVLPESSPVIATNGCFDLLHPGHLQILEAARSLGSTLIVGVTCDFHVRRLKGPDRPILNQQDRALSLAALGCVSFVTIFDEPDACEFLAAASPHLYVKGGDYTLNSMNQRERQFLERANVEIRFLPYVSAYSTTTIIAKVKSNLFTSERRTLSDQSP